MKLSELQRAARLQARIARHHLDVLEIIRSEIRVRVRKSKRRSK